MINIALCDDAEDMASLLESFIRRYENEHGEKIHVLSYKNGIDLLSDYNINTDIVFLDIDMPMMDGLSVAKKIRERDPYVTIIFVSNLKQYVIKGYEVNAMDYIIKPIDYKTFEVKLAKAIAISSKFQQKKIKLKVGSEYLVFDVMDIIFVEVSGSYLTVHTTKGEYKIKGPLYVIAETLGTTHFAMCNSCYLVNMNYVDKFDKSKVTVAGHELLFSRHKKKEFLEQLDIYLGNVR